MQVVVDDDLLAHLGQNLVHGFEVDPGTSDVWRFAVFLVERGEERRVTFGSIDATEGITVSCSDGLLSFTAMDIAPLRTFGAFTAVGIFATLVFSLTFVPAVVAPSGSLAMGYSALVRLSGGVLAKDLQGTCGFWGGGWEVEGL